MKNLLLSDAALSVAAGKKMKELNMKRFWVARVLKFILFAILGVLLFGFVVMRLWNWLMPPLFGLHAISFAQALGLLILGKILFGGFHHGGARGRWRSGMRERWAQMTPEEREKFRAGLHRCGRGFAQAGTPPADASQSGAKL
jgi:hypothetical protein